MGSNIQPAEKAFRNIQGKGLEQTLPGILITPPPARVELLAPPAKKSSRARAKSKQR